MLLFLFSCLSLLFFLLEISPLVLTLSVHAGLFRCFHSPSNSAMDDRIFNACMHSLQFLWKEKCSLQFLWKVLTAVLAAKISVHCSSCEKKSTCCSSCDKNMHSLQFLWKALIAVLVKSTHCSSCEKHSLQFLWKALIAVLVKSTHCSSCEKHSPQFLWKVFTAVLLTRLAAASKRHYWPVPRQIQTGSSGSCRNQVLGSRSVCAHFWSCRWTLHSDGFCSAHGAATVCLAACSQMPLLKMGCLNMVTTEKVTTFINLNMQVRTCFELSSWITF